TDATSMFKAGTDGNGTEALDETSLTLLDANGNPATSVTVAEGTYVLENGTITFTPNTNYTGDVTPVTVRMADLSGDTATATYTPRVINLTPTAKDRTSEDYINVAQTTNATSMFKAGTDGNGTEALDETSLTLLDANGNPATSVTVAEGTYVLDNGTITFTPNTNYTGDVTPVTVRMADLSGDPATATYTPTVINLTPTGEDRETEGPQGQAQTTDASTMFTAGTDGTGTEDLDMSTLTLLDANGNPTTSVTVDGQGTYTLENGVITFQPLPSFVGTATPVRVRVQDLSGDPATNIYTPTVTDVTMTSENAVSSAVQGSTQTGTPTFETSDPSVTVTGYTLVGADAEGKVVIEGEGTYTIDQATGEVTFVPDPSFTGTGTGVTVTATDSNGETQTATYTPTVTPAEITATGDESTGVQGATQTGQITSEITNGDNVTKTTYTFDGETTKVVPGEGTYTIDPETGKVTFIPEPSFTGTATPVEVTVTATIRNQDGSESTISDTATYTPTVTPAEITATGDESTGVQGATQTGQITSEITNGDNVTKTTYTFDGETTKVVPGEGTYTIDPETGKVTFIPEPSFTGTATPVEVTVTATIRNQDGSESTISDTATYTPTVTPAEITATGDESTGVQGATQTGQITSEITNGDNVTKTTYTFDGETTKVVPGEGTYTIDPETGKVTFIPEPSFTGTATPVEVTVTATIRNQDGSESTISDTATYTPTVTPAEITATGDESTGVQGATQTGQITSEITNGDNVTKTTYTFDGETTKVVPGEGTYTIDPETGKVTFIPEPSFTGTATPVEVTVTATIRNQDGSESTISDTATYTPTVTPTTTSFVDGDGNPLLPNEEGNVPSKDIPGYEIISSTTDENGNTVHTYRKVTTPTTSFVDGDGNPLLPNEEGNVPSKDIPGYEIISSTTDENGNTVHTYRKVTTPTTSFVDGDGNPLLPNEEGNVPSKDIPGYEIISSTTDENGNTVHTYRKVTTPVTSFVDEDGNVISPNEDGKQPSKAISGYELVGSSTDENGNVVHTYRKVVKTTTSFVDGDGNPILPNEEGNVPSKDIPGYEIISSTTDENGNLVHTYRKVVKTTTSFVDGDGNPILPNEEGNVPSKDISGYEIVSSTTDANGNTIHTYRKVTTPMTSFVDEEGNVISPNEDGKQPSKDISDYKLVGSSTDENGNVVHTYRKVVKTTTSFVDGDGNPILPNEDGNVPSKDIPGYEIVSSTTDENDNTVHTYRKVVKQDEPSVVTPNSPKASTLAKPAEAKPAPATKTTNKLEVLPNTGTENTATASALGVGMILTALGLAGKRRRKED
ncbi:LPXTG cell wall anchor domain-containing protein, partial [Streptococcus sp. sy004]|uniref:LPXTG cell wall anchor domain-containing protein n=1 Tax=Streptococcus sp. sy004 TaxID=2600149 RepID=UPI001C93766C